MQRLRAAASLVVPSGAGRVGGLGRLAVRRAAEFHSVVLRESAGISGLHLHSSAFQSVAKLLELREATQTGQEGGLDPLGGSGASGEVLHTGAVGGRGPRAEIVCGGVVVVLLLEPGVDLLLRDLPVVFRQVVLVADDHEGKVAFVLNVGVLGELAFPAYQILKTLSVVQRENEYTDVGAAVERCA